MRKGARTRQQVLDAATELFQRQGYHATALNQVVSAAAAPKGSLYFHFPGGKQQLAVEAVESAGRRVCELIDELLREADGVRPAVAAIVRLFSTVLEESGFRSGCPVATVALEASEDEAVRAGCERAYGSWLESLAAALRAQGVHQGRAEDLAVLTLSTMEGALLLSRVQRDLRPLRVAGEQLVQTLRAAGAR